MSKIDVSVDTETKTLSCTIDGEEITNVESVYAYAYGEDEDPDKRYYSIELCLNEGDIAKKIRKVSRIFSSGSKLDKNTSLLEKTKIDAKGTILYTKHNLDVLSAQASRMLGKYSS